MDVTAPIVTVAARADISAQLFDRRGPAGDAHITATLLDALDHEQERQLLHGSGSAGEMTGLRNTAGINVVACSTASATIVTQKALEAARVGAEYRRRPTRIIAMSPTRNYWLGAATAGSSQPAPAEVLRWADLTPVSTGGMSMTLGASSNEDRIVALNGTDVVYAEDPIARVTAVRGQTPGAGTVTLLAWRYAALCVLYPSAVSAVSGTGLAQPAAF